MNSLFDGFVLNVMVHLVNKPSGHWNIRSCWRVSQAVGPELKNYSERKPFGLLKCEVKWIADGTVTEGLAGGTAQKWQQTWESDNTVMCSSHQGGSPQDGLRDEQTCGTTLASACVLRTVICKSTCPENYIPVVMSPLKYTSLSSTVATFLATHLMAVLQPSKYSVFHNRDTPIQLSLPWQSYSCQCLNTETPSISYIISLYIRLVVTL